MSTTRLPELTHWTPLLARHSRAGSRPRERVEHGPRPILAELGVVALKEAQPSVLERFVGASEHANHGQWVVVGQRLMQAASDIFLGWIRVKDLDGHTRDYYIRQLHDWKGAVEVETFRVPGATFYGAYAARPSRGHVRAGATGPRSPRTWASPTRSTRRSRTSRPRTLTGTRGTTRRSPGPSSRVG